jgi:DNA-binding response OmpR family regulator
MIALPLKAPMVPAPDLIMLPVPLEAAIPAQREPSITILVAEDDPVSRELICTRVAKWGYDVIVAQNGTDAMTVLREKDAPSLAILDWMMPGMDGLEICRRVREVNRVVYLILLSARGTKQDIVAGLNAGADDYLVKPFDKDELQARIIVGLRTMVRQAMLGGRAAELATEMTAFKERKLEMPL